MWTTWFKKNTLWGLWAQGSCGYWLCFSHSTLISTISTLIITNGRNNNVPFIDINAWTGFCLFVYLFSPSVFITLLAYLFIYLLSTFWVFNKVKLSCSLPSQSEGVFFCCYCFHCLPFLSHLTGDIAFPAACHTVSSGLHLAAHKSKPWLPLRAPGLGNSGAVWGPNLSPCCSLSCSASAQPSVGVLLKRTPIPLTRCLSHSALGSVSLPWCSALATSVVHMSIQQSQQQWLWQGSSAWQKQSSTCWPSV